MATLLVIDDEAHIRRFVSANLTQRGYDVLQAENAEGGLEFLRDTPPDVVLLDIKLPGMDGWAFLDMLNTDDSLPKVPVVVITGSMLYNEAVQHQYPNLVDVLIKPMSVQQLLRAVERALSWNEQPTDNPS